MPAFVIIPAGQTSATFTLTLPTDSAKDGSQTAIVTASAEWYDRLGVRDFPTVILLDRKGIIRARYLGWLPSHLAVLNVIGRLQGTRATS